MNRYLLVAVLPLLAAASTVSAETRTWTGATSEGWSEAGNWGGAAPAPGDDLVFPAGAQRLSNNNDFPEDTSFRSITVNGGGYRLSGNRVRIGAGGISSTAGDVTIEIALTVTAAQTWSVTGGVLTIRRGVQWDSYPLTLYTSGGDGVMTSFSTGTGTLTKTGPGDWSLFAEIWGGGNVSIEAGRLIAHRDYVLGRNVGSFGEKSLSIAAAGTFDLNSHLQPLAYLAGAGKVMLGDGGRMIVCGADFSGVISGHGQFFTTGYCNVTLSGHNTFTGSVGFEGITFRSGVFHLTGSIVASFHQGTFAFFTMSNGASAGPLFISSRHSGFMEIQGPVSSAGLDLDGRFQVRFDGVQAGQYGSLRVAGTVQLRESAQLLLSGNAGTANAPGTQFVIIDNDGEDPVIGTFQGLPEGAILPGPGPFYSRLTYAGGTGNDVVVTVIGSGPIPPRTTTTTLSSHPNPAAMGQDVTFVATVTPASPDLGPVAGMVDLVDVPSGNVIASAPVEQGGTATFILRLPAGMHQLRAVFAGSAVHLASQSAVLEQTVSEIVPVSRSALIALALSLAAIAVCALRR